MPASSRKPPSGSPADHQQSHGAMDDIDDGIEVPDYLSDIAPLSQNEYARWDVHIASRTVWRESELIPLYQLVKLETRAFNAMAEIMSEEMTILNNQGNVIPNPAHAVYGRMQTEILSIRRALGIDADKTAVQRHFKRAKGKNEGKEENTAPQVEKRKVASLIKLPKY